jgi:LysM repeat protein
VATTAPVTTTAPTTTRERTATAPAEFYTVESGDTYGSIAAEQGTSVDELRTLNPEVDETALQPGQRIRVK